MIHFVALNIFHRNPGLQFIARWAHVVVGIVWIGILYYFNFVQTPAFAQMDASARNNAIDKLASRALWWFRWAAASTLLTGILILLAEVNGKGDAVLFDGDYWKSPEGISIATGILLAVTMFLNVWLVIWPNQKQVIANARNVQSGGQADPAVADAARRSALASRQNTIFSFPMLLFMVGTANFFGGYNTGSNRGGYWAVTGVIWLLFEVNALGYLGGRAAGRPNLWIYEDHWRAIVTGVVLSGVWYALWQIFFV